jgi:hypothetical protein
MVKVNNSETRITEAEILRMIDKAARARLGISGEQMLSQYSRGELADPSAVADLIALADLLKQNVAA